MTRRETSVRLPIEYFYLAGDLRIPDDAKGIVLFTHGSGSSRASPRNRFVANVLNEARFATLLMDLLTEKEEVEDTIVANLRFDIPLLAERVAAASAWLRKNDDTRGLPIGYFGASTGAAAALAAAGLKPELVKAVVSRGGRPDLAGTLLGKVRAPTLLIVGGNDPVVLQLNQDALTKMQAGRKIVIVPEATHLFEEQGALEQVANLARDWFELYLK
ncbi:MAG: dienelactone hydrolase family protein [Chloroflexi bacterium]|nr:dienelactone hydrolase family protein [Chloroflexota bacterium]